MLSGGPAVRLARCRLCAGLQNDIVLSTFNGLLKPAVHLETQKFISYPTVKHTLFSITKSKRLMLLREIFPYSELYETHKDTVQYGPRAEFLVTGRLYCITGKHCELFNTILVP